MVARTSRRLARAVSLAAVVSVVIPVFLAGPVSAARPIEERMLQFINRARVERGHQRLEMTPYLVRNARSHSRKMANEGEWFHNERLARQLAGRPWRLLGENVGHATRAWWMHHWFMHSRSHRHNLLEGDFDRIGIGIVRRGDTLWFTQVFAG